LSGGTKSTDRSDLMREYTTIVSIDCADEIAYIWHLGRGDPEDCDKVMAENGYSEPSDYKVLLIFEGWLYPVHSDDMTFFQESNADNSPSGG
jgi:hypothetical protein